MMAAARNDPRKSGTIWAVNLDENKPALQPRIPVVFRHAGPETLEPLVAAMGEGLRPEILRRFEAGKRCYAAWAGERIAAYGWVSRDDEYIGEFNLRVRLLLGEAYIWDCLTVPAYRRQGIYSALLIHILKELQQDGLCRAWIGADMDNVASQRGIARAGFHFVADMVLARVLAMRMVWVQGRPGVPEGAVAEARRAFLDNRDTVWLKGMALSRNSAQEAFQPQAPLAGMTGNANPSSDSTLAGDKP